MRRCWHSALAAASIRHLGRNDVHGEHIRVKRHVSSMRNGTGFGNVDQDAKTRLACQDTKYPAPAVAMVLRITILLRDGSCLRVNGVADNATPRLRTKVSAGLS